MLGWCEVTTCRRRHLLAYFGDAPPADCGNCDICLRPPLTWNGTEAAQKALSCVYRTGKRFGAGHLIDVLRGQSRDKVLRFHHEELSTFGIGAEFSDAQWRSIFRQLVVRGYLGVDHDHFGALRLTDSSRPLLRGETTLALREDPEKPKAVRARSKATESLNIEDEELMQALRDLRHTLAQKQDVPAYVVFHDRTLREMAALRPRTREGLAEIHGVGDTKLDRYGEQFLECLRGHA